MPSKTCVLSFARVERDRSDASRLYNDEVCNRSIDVQVDRLLDSGPLRFPVNESGQYILHWWRPRLMTMPPSLALSAVGTAVHFAAASCAALTLLAPLVEPAGSHPPLPRISETESSS
jgi:hypothetical protein